LIAIFISIVCASVSVEAKSVLDLLKGNTNNAEFTLDKHFKKNVGSLFSRKLKIKYPKLYDAIENKDYNKALALWSSSFRRTSFARSSTGHALYGFMMFKNNWKVVGIKHLLDTANPKDVHPIVHNLWKSNINVDDEVWDYFIYSWSQEWTKFFNEEIAFKVGSKKDISIVKDRKYIEYLLGLPINDKDYDKLNIEWSLVLSLIQDGDMNSATKILTYFLRKNKDMKVRNGIHLTIARLLYDIGEYEASLQYYNKVKGLSFYWLLAKQEKSWIFYKNGDYYQFYANTSAFTYDPLK